MIAILKKPYPIEEDKRKILIRTFAISAFVAFFLMLFEPFELGSPELKNKRWIQLSFGFACFVASILAEFIIRPLLSDWFSEKTWVVWKQIIWILFSLFLIGTANLLITWLWGIVPLSIQAFWLFQKFTTLVGIFPVTAIVLINEYTLLKRNIKKATELNKSIDHSNLVATPEQVLLISESPKEEFRVRLFDLFLVEASSNYITVYYQSDGKVLKKVLRNSLSYAVQSLPQELFVRCHRSYIINAHKVNAVSGNAQGFKLILEGIDEPVPVGRTYQDACINIIQQKK